MLVLIAGPAVLFFMSMDSLLNLLYLSPAIVLLYYCFMSMDSLLNLLYLSPAIPPHIWQYEPGSTGALNSSSLAI